MRPPALSTPQMKRMFAKDNQHSPVALVRSHRHSDKTPAFSLVRVGGFFLFFILKHQEGTQQTPHFYVVSLGWWGSRVGVSFLRRG